MNYVLGKGFVTKIHTPYGFEFWTKPFTPPDKEMPSQLPRQLSKKSMRSTK